MDSRVISKATRNNESTTDVIIIENGPKAAERLILKIYAVAVAVKIIAEKDDVDTNCFVENWVNNRLILPIKIKPPKADKNPITVPQRTYGELFVILSSLLN